jgi:hypothetical protein
MRNFLLTSSTDLWKEVCWTERQFCTPYSKLNYIDTLFNTVKWRRYYNELCLAYFPKVGLCDPQSVCVPVYPPLSTIECLNQSPLNLWCISWQLSPSQRRTSWIPPISLCARMCIPLIVARQWLGKHVPTATNTHNNRKDVGLLVFLCSRCLVKGESVGLPV